MNDPTTTSALREAIQADMNNRLAELADRLESEVEVTERIDELDRLFTDALTEATRVFASGFAARVKEGRKPHE